MDRQTDNQRFSEYVNKQPSTQCRACGTINISKYVNNVLSTNPTTLILSSLVRNLRKNQNLLLFFFFFFFLWGLEGGGVSELILTEIQILKKKFERGGAGVGGVQVGAEIEF